MKEDYEFMLKEFEKLAEFADEVNDRGTAGIADEKIASFQKRLWMLDSMLK